MFARNCPDYSIVYGVKGTFLTLHPAFASDPFFTIQPALASDLPFLGVILGEDTTKA